MDVRHERRPLTPDEFDHLLAAAGIGKRFGKLSGPDRAMLYTVAAYTGFRASELASLTPSSFALDAATPTLTVEAGYSKHRGFAPEPTPNEELPQKSASCLKRGSG